MRIALLVSAKSESVLLQHAEDIQFRKQLINTSVDAALKPRTGAAEVGWQVCLTIQAVRWRFTVLLRAL